MEYFFEIIDPYSIDRQGPTVASDIAQVSTFVRTLAWLRQRNL
ncbi:hypothetical protein GA004_00150 [Candidatus Pelagisphaera phototrophica]|nr:hypothetical protein GA004_00150 [Candidatus Pelagisphaera phototrophica]